MTSYDDKLKKLFEDWDETEAASSGFSPLPVGSYQCVITGGEFVPASKAPFAQGQPQIRINASVLTNEYKGKPVNIDFFPAQPANPQRNQQSGKAKLKGFAQELEIDPDLLRSVTGMAKMFKQITGTKIKVYVGKSGAGYYSGVLDPDTSDSEWSPSDY